MILCFPVLGLETEDRGTAEADEALVSPSEITTSDWRRGDYPFIGLSQKYKT
ncbi:MAG: hypothetical protein P8L78_10900 [Mariniblastus sp.]|nr:hypothetical protein [Mariniblastus sp.]MDG2182192.1 hypothetical protein [Mariniblastus sp.]